VAANVQDEAPGAFAMPAYMQRLIDAGHLGDKTAAKGRLHKKVTGDGKTTTQVLDPASGTYREQDPDLRIPFVEEIQDLNRRGRYHDDMDRFMAADGAHAATARRVILGYVSYALHRVGPGEVVESPADADRIMSAGFNWAPPTALVDLIGA